jgi:two-component system chemotaxis response regulator CheB
MRLGVMTGSDADVTRVLVCDDSAAVRTSLVRMLQTEPRIHVVGQVCNGQDAVAAVRGERVDLVILDIAMPLMDGLTALPLLLKASPGLKVIMASTLTSQGAEIAMRALRLGAVDYLAKPGVTSVDTAAFRSQLIGKIVAICERRSRAAAAIGRLRPAPKLRPRLLAVGSSTGGPQALFTFIRGLGGDLGVPVVITQHMPAAFTPVLADHLGRIGPMPCREATDGEHLHGGHIYLAPGDRHLTVRAVDDGFRAQLTETPPENFCRPSVDPMLRSAVEAANGRVLVVMLTGMGQDGLAGTRLAVDRGGCALAQDEATSVVWGMPGAIARAGLCHDVLPIDRLGLRARALILSGQGG